MTYKPHLLRLIAPLLWAGQIFLTSAHSNPADLLPRFIVRFLWNTTLFGQRLFFLLGPLGHAINFGVLAILLAWALFEPRLLPPARFRLAFAFSFLYALSDEIHQVFVPTRTFQVRDLVVDAFGALLGLALFQTLSLMHHRKSALESPLL
jgi:VanZ family protein